MEIHFTNEEKINMLKRAEYNIQEVDTWLSISSYHNSAEYTECKIIIAIPPGNKISAKDMKQDKHWFENNYGIDTQFNLLMKKVLVQSYRDYLNKHCSY